MSRSLERAHRRLGVWWGTLVEVRSAFHQLAQEKAITREELPQCLARLAVMRQFWDEVPPNEKARDLAGTFPEKCNLRAADAFQLAAALVWCRERPRNRPFICFDRRLAKAAEEAGFTVYTNY